MAPRDGSERCAHCLRVWGGEIERYLKEIDDLKARLKELEEREENRKQAALEARG